MIRRKIVQHGPSTLTVSLPAQWTKHNRLHKGDEILISEGEHEITLRPHSTITTRTTKRIDVSCMHTLLSRILGATYKMGHDDLILTYSTPEDLKEIHRLIRTQYIGMEIVDETQTSVHVRAVSTTNDEEFAPLFRRMFHFLNAIAQDSLEAAHTRDPDAYRTLVLRDESINRLTDFCARVLLTHGQHEYHSDAVLYDLIDQIEKVGDAYKHLHLDLQTEKLPINPEVLELYEYVTRLVCQYTELFFSFTLQKAHEFQMEQRTFLEQAEAVSGQRIVRHLRRIMQELFNLMDATIMLHV